MTAQNQVSDVFPEPMDGPYRPPMLIDFIQRGNLTHIRGFIKEGCDVNFCDEAGMSALHHAVAMGARPVIRLLVASGQCDYLIRDKMGRTASDIAIEWTRDYAVARLLSKHQARQAHASSVRPFKAP